MIVFLAGALAAVLSGAGEVERWSVYEGSFEHGESLPDPVRDLEVTVEITSPGGRKAAVNGFWDGGRTYRFRFMPEEAGAHAFRYRLKGPRSEIETEGGSFACIPSKGGTPFLEHGPVGVSSDGHHLVHADGTPFFWLGCTAWNGALSPDPAGWRDYLADRRQKKFTVIQFVATQWRAAKGDREGRVAFEGRERIALNPAFFQRLDGMVNEVNQKGLAASPVILWAIGDFTGRSPGSTLPESEAILLAKYIVARYGAHHVLWTLGGDGAYGGEKAEKWKRIGRAVFPDPRRSVVTMHPQGMQWVAREFEGEPWFDFLGYQSGHGDDDHALRWLAEGPPAAAWRMNPPHPVINMEPNYEGHLAYHSMKPITDFMVRRAAYWSLLISPPAGVTYGAHGIWYFSDRAETPLEHKVTGVAPPWREAMKLPGSTHMKHLRTLFDSIEWWRLRPDPDLVLNQPGKDAIRRFVAAARSEPGDLAVVYVPEDRQVTLEMDRFPSAMEVRWFNPRTGESGSLGGAPRNEAKRFLAPVDGDWVLVLERPKAARPGPPFDDAVAFWDLRDLNDAAGKNSTLEAEGNVELLRVAEDSADPTSASLKGGWLDAGQGTDGELNLKGEQMTMLIRLRDPSGKWDTSLFSKHGGHGNLVYNLFTVNLGSGMDLGFELGTEKGMFQVKSPIAEIGEPDAWHLVIASYDGARLRLFVDGAFLDEVPASGRLREKNAEPCILGGESQGGKVIRPFRGTIARAALWSRALSLAEIASLSGRTEKTEKEVLLEREGRAERRAAALREKLSRDHHRPRYHFAPPAHWMNDPNGLCQWKGEYHLFYQHNPHGAFWGTMHWGHARSKDLVRWEHLPIALAPTPGGPDWNGVFSGSFADDGGVPTLVYTGVSPEVQCIATSRDGLLTWEKHPANPVIGKPPEGMEVTGFRDPYVFREEDGWYAVIGSGIRGVGGAALLYRSSDLRKWEYLHPLVVGKKEHGEMWECPNFFPLGGKSLSQNSSVGPRPSEEASGEEGRRGDMAENIVEEARRSITPPQPAEARRGSGIGSKHVLLVSVHGTVLYFTGTYRDRRFAIEREGNTDHGGHFYAALCFRDEKGRRILFGWVTEGRSDAAQRAAGWSGAQSLPRVLSLLPDGRLGMEPAEEVKTLRGKKLEPRPDDGAHNQWELVEEVEQDGASEVGLEIGNEEEKVVVAYLPKDGRIVVRKRPGAGEKGGPLELAPGEPLRLRVFFDASILEVFANGRACFTTRLYPTRPGLRAVEFNQGGSVRVKNRERWELTP